MGPLPNVPAAPATNAALTNRRRVPPARALSDIKEIRGMYVTIPVTLFQQIMNG